MYQKGLHGNACSATETKHQHRIELDRREVRAKNVLACKNRQSGKEHFGPVPWPIFTVVRFLYLNLNEIQQNHNFCKCIYLHTTCGKGVIVTVERESAIISTISFQLEIAFRNSD